MRIKLRHTWLFIFLLYCFQVSGQQFDPGTIESPDENEIPEDTVTVQSFSVTDIKVLTTFSDTSLDNNEVYARARTFDRGAYTLGNLGSAQVPLIYRIKKDILTDPGFHQYDLYKTELSDFKYYRIGHTAFNDYAFTPVDGDENTKFSARFSTNFANDVNFSINLDRINQIGFYRNQSTRSTAFGVGIWKQRPDKNRQTFFTFLANNHNEEHNGGVTNFNSRIRSSIPSILNEASTRHEDFKYFLDNFFTILGQRIEVHHQVMFEHGFYVYGDDELTFRDDTLVYPQNYVTDDRGIRYFLGFHKIKNIGDINFNYKGINLNVGVLHQWSRFRTDTNVESVHDATLFSELKVNVGRITELDGRLELGFGSNSGNLLLDTGLKFKAIKDLNLEARLTISRYDPTLIQRSVDVTFQNIFSNEFSKVNEIQISGIAAYEKIGLSMAFNSGIITNPISYDNSALPIQSSGSTEYIQLIAKHRFFWKFIGMENSGIIQEFSDNVFRLPNIYSTHNLYIQTPLFKKRLLARFGGLYYNIQTGERLSFLPITGSFYPSGEEFDSYPYFEAYASFQISQFRMFVKAENVVDFFVPQEHFLVSNYAQFDRNLRVGIRWVLRE